MKLEKKDNDACKLTEEDIEKIKLLKSTHSYKELSLMFNVHISTIKSVFWTEEYRKEVYKRKYLSRKKKIDNLSEMEKKEYFALHYKNSARKTYLKEYKLLRRDMIEKSNKANIKWKSNNRDKYLQVGRNSYYKHKEERLKNAKEYAEKNKDKIKVRKRLYRLRNKEEIKDKAKIYYKKNREKLLKKAKEKYINNKNK